MRGITEDERALLTHVMMFGSDGYPVYKLGRRWSWGPWRSIKGPNTTWKTKREATKSFEAFQNILMDAIAGRI